MSAHTAKILALSGIFVMIVAALIGPYVSHAEYSQISHTTSELAGQGVPNAWIMRLGFAAYGLGTALAALSILRRAPLLAMALILFGVGLLGASIWSSATFPPAPGTNQTEDAWHSYFSSAIGIAFALATLTRLSMAGFPRSDWLSWLGLLASVLLPLAMVQFPSIDGLLQRVLFAISFLWIARLFMSRDPS